MDPKTRHVIVERGQKLYEQTIRAQIELDRMGQFVVLDVESGEYEVGSDKLETLDRLIARLPRAIPYIVRAGRPTAVTIR